MLKALSAIASIVQGLMKIGPFLYNLFTEYRRKQDAKKDAKVIRDAKNAKTPEERAKSAKDIINRTNS